MSSSHLSPFGIKLQGFAPQPVIATMSEEHIVSTASGIKSGLPPRHHHGVLPTDSIPSPRGSTSSCTYALNRKEAVETSLYGDYLLPCAFGITK